MQSNMMVSTTSSPPLKKADKEAHSNSTKSSGEHQNTASSPSSDAAAAKCNSSKPSFVRQVSLADTLNVEHPETGDPDGQADHRPVVLGHRGAIYKEPENTVRSFETAAELGCDGFELDVFVLKCGTLVCFHGGGGDVDPGDLYDYCGIEGNIMDYTAEEARNFPLDPEGVAFGIFPIDKLKHATIPTLEEVLELAKETGQLVKIELKGPGTPDPAVELVERMGMQDQVYFSSFYHDRIARVRELRPQTHPDGTHVFKTGALFRVPPDNFVEVAKDVDATEVHLRFDTCSKERVDAIHEAGMDSLAWFRGPPAMKEMSEKFVDAGNEDHVMYQTVLNSGVAAMIVNKPDVLLEHLDDEKKSSD